MKKLYNNKGKIHPSPPPNDDHFSLLPAAIITLATALSPQDKEVLAYLISCSSSCSISPNKFSGSPKSTAKVNGSGGDHPAEFHCDCFRCYMSYWVRWDASPNRQLIHEIIEAYEDGVFDMKQIISHERGKKERRKKVAPVVVAPANDDCGESEPVEVLNIGRDEDGELLDCEQSGVSTVRKLVSFIGEKIWGVWGII